ncbi:hypothetical protein [Bradyrhizobium commune]|uniref:DUF2232 domain-containing protein n=1 Tax=Bradyrhizobium commune TaxID=83627 RepID=A0A7S9DCK2_9BRAD|nr:hypothetical protein [Bradyrhizobium commune]QPF95272.1 hypothetical protein IC761_20860 [Bradyrhizobium commune]
MMVFGLIALIAGAASALMFASISSGVLISLVLYFLAPLPLMVAAIVWGPLCAALGGIIAAIGLGSLLRLSDAAGFMVMVALPSCWLGHLALLGRPVDGDATGTPSTEWYPLGRILLWIAGLAIFIVMGLLLTLGTDADTINQAMRGELLRVMTQIDPAAASELPVVIDAIIVLGTISAAMMMVITLALNLWLAAKVAAASGLLRRPWQDLKTVTLPAATLVGLCVAMAFCFTGGLAGIFARIVAAALMMAYGLTGFAVLHTLTLSLKSRPFWLASAYTLAFIPALLVIAMVALGLADAVFGFRERFLRSRQPPPLPTS